MRALSTRIARLLEQPLAVGRTRTVEPGQKLTLYPGESAFAELPDLDAMVRLMESDVDAALPLRWRVYPTPTLMGLARRIWFRLLWWLPVHGKPNLDVSMHSGSKETVH